ncbi:MAG: hypothetical protein IJM90_05680 [Firmicutes bacterium]|nr:hypothetical protein [Bacillota bacterium]
MNADDLMQSIGEVDEAWIEAASRPYPVSRTRLKVLIAAAACLTLIIGGIAFYHWGLQRPWPWDSFVNPVISSEITTSESMTIPAAPVSVESFERTAAACFGKNLLIYHGHVYLQIENLYYPTQIIGEHLGHVSPLIEVWITRDEWVEQAGTMDAEFFAVQGYDPEFMVCVPTGNGYVMPLVRAEDIAFRTAEDLLEDHLQMSGHVAALIYEDFRRRDIEPEDDGFYRLDASHLDVVRGFIKALDRSAFHVITDEERRNLTGQALYTLIFEYDNGLRVKCLLYQNGCVAVDPYYADFCLVISPRDAEPLLRLLERQTGEKIHYYDWKQDLEQVRQTPELGRYIPAELPEGMHLQNVHFVYDLDPGSGTLGQIQEITLGLMRDDGGFINLSIEWRDYYASQEWTDKTAYVAAEELSVEWIKARQEAHKGMVAVIASDEVVLTTYYSGEPEWLYGFLRYWVDNTK